jgi:hypothetical protein
MNNFEKLFEPRSLTENLEKYELRIAQLAGKYSRLKGHEQKFIHAAKDEGFHWRGEPHDLFVQFYEEWERQQSMNPSERKAYRMNKYGFVKELKQQDFKNESFKQQEKLYGEAS